MLEIARWRVRGLGQAFMSVLLAWAPAWADPAGGGPGSIPAEAFYRHAEMDQAALSPSARWLVVKTGLGGERVGLVAFDLEQGGPPKHSVRFGGLDVRSFYWVNDDRLVFTVVDQELGGAVQRVAPGLFSVRPDGSELRQLVKLTRPFFSAPSGAGREPLEWNHVLLDVPAGGGEDVIVGELKDDSRGDLSSINALRLNVATGRAASLSTGVPPHARAWLFDPKGEPRLIEATSKGVTQVHWRAADRKDWVELARFDWLSPSFVPQFIDSAGVLYVTTNDGPGGTAVLKRFDFAAGRPETEAVVRAPGFDFAGYLVTDIGSGRTVGLRVETDAITSLWFDPQMKATQQTVDAKLPGRINQLSCRRCGEPRMVVLVHSSSDQDPGQYWIYRPDGERWQSVGPARTGIDPRQMATLDFHRIKARDGLEMPVWITTPRGPAAAAPRPAVVLVHGGPWVRGGHWQWDADAQFLASRGYLVIEPEFRGSTGYGDKHFKAGWKQWGLAMQDDVADAVAWAVVKGWVDPKRVCIAGASYGGYATLMGLIRHPELYRCGAAWVAVTDPRLLYELDWVSDLSEEHRKFGLPVMLGDPVKDAAALAAAAPVELAARIKAPLLLAFGVEDRRVPLEHGQRMRAALRAAGHEPEWVTYPGEGHGWWLVENRVDFARRLERFLAKHLQP